MYLKKHKLVIITNRHLLPNEQDLVQHLATLLHVWKASQIEQSKQAPSVPNWLRQAYQIKIIIREPDLPVEERYQLARDLKTVCQLYPQVQVILNGNPLEFLSNDLSDVVFHVPVRYKEAWQTYGEQIKQTDVKPKFTISGTSIHNLEEHKFVEANLKIFSSALEYALISPIFPTNCKPGAVGIGLEGLQKMPKFPNVDYYALGGIGEHNIASVLNAHITGVVGVAVMSEAMQFL